MRGVTVRGQQQDTKSLHTCPCAEGWATRRHGAKQAGLHSCLEGGLGVESTSQGEILASVVQQWELAVTELFSPPPSPGSCSLHALEGHQRHSWALLVSPYVSFPSWL